MSGTAPVFRARGLTKVYHVGEVDIFALRGIDLDLFAGEFVVLLGACGSGYPSIVFGLWLLIRYLPHRAAFIGLGIALFLHLALLATVQFWTFSGLDSLETILESLALPLVINWHQP